MYLTLPMIGVIGIFVAIFVASQLAKLNSPVVDACAWILGILLFVFILLSKLPL
jgi:hypothetical protein